MAGKASPVIYVYTVTLERFVGVGIDGEEEWVDDPDFDVVDDGFESYAGVMGDDGEWVLPPHGENPEDSLPYREAEDRLLARLGLSWADLTDATEDLP